MTLVYKYRYICDLCDRESCLSKDSTPPDGWLIHRVNEETDKHVCPKCVRIIYGCTERTT